MHFAPGTLYGYFSFYVYTISTFVVFTAFNRRQLISDQWSVFVLAFLNQLPFLLAIKNQVITSNDSCFSDLFALFVTSRKDLKTYFPEKRPIRFRIFKPPIIIPVHGTSHCTLVIIHKRVIKLIKKILQRFGFQEFYSFLDWK